MSVYSYQAVTTANQEVSLDLYQGKVLVIANTASKCGLTPQYGELQSSMIVIAIKVWLYWVSLVTSLEGRSQVQVRKRNHFARLTMV